MYNVKCIIKHKMYNKVEPRTVKSEKPNKKGNQ